MTCQIEQIADCGDIASTKRALFMLDTEDESWLSQCNIALSSCGSLLAISYRNRLCLHTNQWISSTKTNAYLISWSGTLNSEITALLVLPICPSSTSQNVPDWLCIIVGFVNGNVEFYSNTGHLLFSEKLDDKPVLKISCHMGTYGTLQDDIHIFFSHGVCILSGSPLFQTLRYIKANLAKVKAGVQLESSSENRHINKRKWIFSEQDNIKDAVTVGLQLKTTYDYLLAASTYGGYDVWYHSVPPANSLILAAGINPYLGFHIANEGGSAPPLQDVARAVANKIKSALPGWLRGNNPENTQSLPDAQIKSEILSMRDGLYDLERHGTNITLSPDRLLAAVVDNLGRVSVVDTKKGHLIRLFKGYRDAQCAFVQIFEQENKKPHMSVVKQLKRAIFLIIYNPKKGLIDVRLMQRGDRIAVFTATKNGRLIYNTSGLVGAEKNYTHKKLNIPEYQCALLDPDGKIKIFDIPFFYVLDSKSSERSKDLQVLRELRHFIKNHEQSTDFEVEIVKKISTLKTLKLKKHCLEILIRSCEVPPRIISLCLNVFLENIDIDDVNEKDFQIKRYMMNLKSLSDFYQHITYENAEDLNYQTENKSDTILMNEDELKTIHLLEDDSCILERLLILAQENNFKNQLHSRVTFSENNQKDFKEFVSCFDLENDTQYISFKSDIPEETYRNVAHSIFSTIFNLPDFRCLTNIVQNSNIDPKDIVKLIIVHFMNMQLEKITIELIEKFIIVLYYTCLAAEEATHIAYQEQSPWWQAIRLLLIDMACPLRSMIIAMICKTVGKTFEHQTSQTHDDTAWESVSKENANWGMLIGKLEDISILSIILMFKCDFVEGYLPKLQMDTININLKYIHCRGRGSVTELIAKWLCTMGVPPEAVIANELVDIYDDPNYVVPETDDNDESSTYLYFMNNRKLIDKNPQIFKWLSLLRRQFPLSTRANYIIANMCWEYAISWQKDMKSMDCLQAVVHCLKNISKSHLQHGLYSIIWSTYIKHVYETACRLINKVGKLPKEALCLQDVGIDNEQLVLFLQICTDYLNNFLLAADALENVKKHKIEFENLWDESMPSLVEVAQNIKLVNTDILSLNYQIACIIYSQCKFNIKFSKPLDTMLDVDYHYVIEALTGDVPHKDVNTNPSGKVQMPRMKFLTKIVRASVNTICSIDKEGPYNTEECDIWIENMCALSESWKIDIDFVRRQQVIASYHVGLDGLVETLLITVQEPKVLLVPLLEISIQRLKRSLQQSHNQSEWMVTVPPQLYTRIQATALDTSIPAHPSLSTTSSVLQRLVYHVGQENHENDHQQTLKLLQLIIESCNVLTKCQL